MNSYAIDPQQLKANVERVLGDLLVSSVVRLDELTIVVDAANYLRVRRFFATIQPAGSSN